ncbi:hypothetical protein INR49_008392 [Caranx melampygus]|nr:hypothetical protein INR49_008392 [Caranx melampygus]
MTCSSVQEEVVERQLHEDALTVKITETRFTLEDSQLVLVRGEETTHHPNSSSSSSSSSCIPVSSSFQQNPHHPHPLSAPSSCRPPYWSRDGAAELLAHYRVSVCVLQQGARGQVKLAPLTGDQRNQD